MRIAPPSPIPVHATLMPATAPLGKRSFSLGVSFAIENVVVAAPTASDADRLVLAADDEGSMGSVTADVDDNVVLDLVTIIIDEEASAFCETVTDDEPAAETACVTGTAGSSRS
jgi:hypothetical protein